MPLTRWLRDTFTRRPAARTRPAARRLSVEYLEDRTTPSGGVLDPTFGGDGMVTLPSDTTQGWTTTAVQPDGKILVAQSGIVRRTVTQTITKATVTRLNPNGSLDTSFGVNGTASLSVGAGATGRVVALQPDGKIVVGCTAWAKSGTWGPSDQEYAVARLNPNGTLDTSFGNKHGWWVANPTTKNEILRELVVAPSGNSFSIYVGADAPQADGSVAFAAVKLTPAGLPDPTFGTGGFAARRVGVNSNVTVDLAVLPTGQVILTGQVVPQAGAGATGALVAFTPAGQPDAGFGTDGVAYLSVHGASRTLIGVQYGGGLAVQGSSLLVAGQALWGPTNVRTGVLLRYTATGAVDPTFGTGGVFVGPGGTAAYFGTLFSDVAVAADGTLRLTGTALQKDAAGKTVAGVLLGSLSADGQPDAAFGPNPDGTGVTAHYGLLPPNSIGSQPAYTLRLTLDADGDFLVGATTTGYPGRGVVMRFTGG